MGAQQSSETFVVVTGGSTCCMRHPTRSDRPPATYTLVPQAATGALVSSSAGSCSRLVRACCSPLAMLPQVRL